MLQGLIPRKPRLQKLSGPFHHLQGRPLHQYQGWDPVFLDASLIHRLHLCGIQQILHSVTLLPPRKGHGVLPCIGNGYLQPEDPLFFCCLSGSAIQVHIGLSKLIPEDLDVPWHKVPEARPEDLGHSLLHSKIAGKDRGFPPCLPALPFCIHTR